MHRRLPDGEIVKNIRERVFPREWFHPNFWPELVFRSKYKELRAKYGRRMALARLWEEAKWEALERSNTTAARIAREAGMTMVLATHRAEVVKALEPDKIIYVGYGTARVEQRR